MTNSSRLSFSNMSEAMRHCTIGLFWGIFTVRNNDDTTLHIFRLKPIAHSLASWLTKAAWPHSCPQRKV